MNVVCMSKFVKRPYFEANRNVNVPIILSNVTLGSFGISALTPEVVGIYYLDTKFRESLSHCFILEVSWMVKYECSHWPAFFLSLNMGLLQKLQVPHPPGLTYKRLFLSVCSSCILPSRVHWWTLIELWFSAHTTEKSAVEGHQFRCLVGSLNIRNISPHNDAKWIAG